MPHERYSGRVVTLYFDSSQERTEITQAALAAKVSFACFCREMIRRGMAIDPTPDISTIRDLQKSKEALVMARRSLRESETARQKIETELFALKHVMLAIPESREKDVYSLPLIDLLKDGHVWRAPEIMEALGIDQKNIDAIKVLGGQLLALSDLKMIEETTKGWRWMA